MLLTALISILGGAAVIIAALSVDIITHLHQPYRALTALAVTIVGACICGWVYGRISLNGYAASFHFLGTLATLLIQAHTTNLFAISAHLIAAAFLGAICFLAFRIGQLQNI